ncbi:uncharacterized protein P174DRAFT_511846 [Aspergillus novofumigatus IBT 16806]|uniref:Secreted protein n=1 Tax=Aspergillus novofumigatus (strain IBT 16806) TaxID=1392255 RepID=A0A2I1CF47_ASPN1|nr:uncharacterized protein P174DRAFT_511846 [Aspergillus novofumigatus IBT 16806]PKX96257.1 hypothetical protein P174DRAFT_511846 [Aspergillus novofumigatus IBT 16806]
MKAHLFALISALPSTLGCLHYLQAAWILDDGVLVCDAAWGSSRTMAGYKVNCITWYGTPHGNFRWSQGYDRSDNFIVWDNWQFC